MSPSAGNRQANDDDNSLEGLFLPTEVSQQFTADNTATLAGRLRAHASWHDLGAVNAHIADELAKVRESME